MKVNNNQNKLDLYISFFIIILALYNLFTINFVSVLSITLPINILISIFFSVLLLISLVVSFVFVSLITIPNISNALISTLLFILLLAQQVISSEFILVMIIVAFYSTFVLLMALFNPFTFSSIFGIFLLLALFIFLSIIF